MTVTSVVRSSAWTAGLWVLLALGTPSPAAAGSDSLCDPAASDCRERILTLIRNESAGIDVAFWFMEDARYTAELVKRFQAGVPVRVLVDTRANEPNPLNADRLAELAAAGIPMRRRTASGILHWKTMLFSGQNTVQFSAANYSASAFVPDVPYQNYVDEVIYVTDDSAVVNSFRTKFDDLWTNTTGYTNYANVAGPLLRSYETFPKDPELNFPPLESYRSRAVKRYDAETQAIDVIMYRVTDRAHSDAMIRAVARGVPVRLITEPDQYRDPQRLWHSWNIDRMYAAGVQVRSRAHAGLLHQKSVVLRGQALTIFGSSNWTSPSSDSQEEHNYFTYKPNFFQFFSDQFERKWSNSTGYAETAPFTPLPPDAPAYITPADTAAGLGTSAVLTWNGGLWAHLYDVYFGVNPDPPLFADNQPLGPSASASDLKRFTVSGLLPGTTYYWKIVAKTMANKSAAGPVFSFTTAGTPGAPAPNASLGPGDILLYAAHTQTITGSWTLGADGTAAGGSRLTDPDGGAAKITTAQANPANYFEMTFTAEAGRAYHLWIRGTAQNNRYTNDSVYVQFSDAVNASGTPVARIGTTGSVEVSIEDGNGAGLSGWGWQDNGWGVLGSHVYFATSGTHTIRIQRREDGISIDQVLLSPEKFLTVAPGAAKNDSTLYPEDDGTGSAPGPGPTPEPGNAPEIVLYASTATISGSEWVLQADSTAAGGAAILNPNSGQPKVVTAAEAPASYAELSFTAEANTPYRLWVRLKAQNNYWANDSIHVQFSDSVDAGGSPVFRIGTTASAEVNLENCSGCGVSGWGWQDNGYGTGVLGPLVYFASAGTHTLRIQRREDGPSIDQVVLSPKTYFNAAPGSLKNDATILPASGGR